MFVTKKLSFCSSSMFGESYFRRSHFGKKDQEG